MDLKKLESDMLEQVYNTILNIPETIVVSIPSLKSPSVLTELKRIRQKLKNKMKMGQTRLTNEYPKSATSTASSTYSQHENQAFNSPKYGSTYTDNSSVNTTYNQTNLHNDSSNTTKWFDNHSDFASNTTPPVRPIFNNTNIYSRERLNVQQLDSIVNDNNFESFTDTDIQKSIQKSLLTNNNFDTRDLEPNKMLPQYSHDEGKNKRLFFLNLLH